MLESPPPHRRLLLIGWDAADWDVITPLMEAGRMPHLARLVREGVSGNLASLRPCLTPMLWTTIATGHTADRHGILGFAEPLPDKSGITASRSTTRRVPAIWNMLAVRGRRSCVVTWPVSDPPEQIPGVYVSAGALETLASQLSDIQALPPGFVHPPGAEESLSDWRFHPCELAVTDLAPFIPDVAHVNLAADRRPEILARHYARCATTHAIATALLEQEKWDLCAVYYETLDRTGHDFMAYRAPLRPGIPEEDARRYGGVVDAMYEFHDAMLGRLLELAGPDTCVCLLSDHGFQSGPNRPVHRPHHGPGVAEDGADWHRMMGIIVLHGPGLRRGERVHGTTLLDVLPTLLTWLGLPVGRDMPGGVMMRAFDPPPAVGKIPSWDAACPSVQQITDAPRLQDARGHFSVLRQFAALGYMPEDALSGENTVLTCLRETQFNLATVYLHHARPAAALALYQELCADLPLHPRYELARLEALRTAENHREALAHIARCENAGLHGAAFDLAAGASLYAINQPDAAAERLQRVITAQPDNPGVLVSAGQLAQLRGHREIAEQWFRRALVLEPAHSGANGGMAAVMLDRGEPEAALEHAVASLRRYFFNPDLHWVLAQALHRLGQTGPALDACRQALLQAPGLRAAREAFANWTSSPFAAS